MAYVALADVAHRTVSTDGAGVWASLLAGMDLDDVSTTPAPRPTSQPGSKDDRDARPDRDRDMGRRDRLGAR